MTTIARLLHLLRFRRRGASLAETGILVGLIAVAAIGAVTLFGDRVLTTFCQAENLIRGVTGDCVASADGPGGPTTPGGGSSGGGDGGSDPDDGIPDVAGLSARLGWPGVTQTFGGIGVGGFDGPLPIVFVDPEQEWLMTIDGESMGQGPFMVNAGNTLAFTLTAPASGVTLNVGFRIGDAEFALPVTGGDVLAEPFSIPAVADAIGTTWTESAAVTPSGFDMALPIAVSGQDALLFIGGSAVGVAAGTLEPGQSFWVGMTSGAEGDEAVSANVALGQSPDVVPAAWSVTAVDLTPDAIVFADTIGHVPGDWAYSGAVEVTGIVDAIPVTLSAGAQASVSNGPWSTAASINPYDSVRFRQRIPEAATAGETFTVSARFGAVGGRPGLVATWSATAGGTDRVPDAFAIPDLLAGEPNQRNGSAEVVLTGFDAAAQIQVSGPGAPMISIDGGPFVVAATSQAATLRPGQRFEVSALAEGVGSSHTVTVEVGNFAAGETVSATWMARVRDLDRTPEAGFRVPDIATPQAYKAHVDSAAVTPTGFSDPIDVVASGAYPADTMIQVNGGDWTAPGGGGLLATLAPGDSFRLRHYVRIADGDPRITTVKVGDLDPYDWTIATLDMLPGGFSVPAQGTLMPSASHTVASSVGGPRYKTTISGLGTGVSLPLTRGVHRYATLDPGDTVVENTTTVQNGDIIGFGFIVPADPGASRTETFDFGGLLVGIDYTVSTVPTDPRYYQFPWLLEAPYGPGQRNWSEWREPTRYGAPMQVSFNAGSDASARYQVWRAGAAEPDPTLYQSMTLTPGDSFRVSVINSAPSATGIPAIIHFHSVNNRTYTWRSRTTASTDQTPNPLADIGLSSGPHSIYTTLPCTRIHSTNSATAITGFDGQITVRLEDADGNYAPIGGNVAGAILGWAGTAGYLNPAQYNGSVNINLCFRIGGNPPAGETIRYRIVAGHPTDPAQQVSTIQEITWAAEDQDPGAFALGADIADAMPGADYATSPIQLNITGTVTASIDGDPSAVFSVNGGPWQSDPAAIEPGNTLSVRLTAAGPDGAATRSATLHIDGYTHDGGKATIRRSSTWSVTARDTTPDALDFPAIHGRTPGTWAPSAARTVSGISVPVAFSLLDPSARVEVNGSGNRVSFGTLSAGDTLRLWRLLDGGHGAAHLTRIVLGSGDPQEWTATTRAEDLIPDAFSWPTSSDEPIGDAAISEAITLSGFLDPADVALVSGPAGVEISIMGEDWVLASTPGLTVAPGQDVRLRWTPTVSGEIRTIEVSIGGVVGGWTVYALP